MILLLWAAVCFALLVVDWCCWAPNRLDADMASEQLLANLLAQKGGVMSTNWYYSTELRVLNTQLVMCGVQLTGGVQLDGGAAPHGGACPRVLADDPLPPAPSTSAVRVYSLSFWAAAEAFQPVTSGTVVKYLACSASV